MTYAFRKTPDTCGSYGYAQHHEFGEGIAEGLGDDAHEQPNVRIDIGNMDGQVIDLIIFVDVHADPEFEKFTQFPAADQIDIGEFGERIQTLTQQLHAL